VNRLATAILLVLPALGCGGDFGSMVHIPPPRHWSEDLARFREAKDEFFRTSAESPLLAAEVAAFAGLEYFEPDASLYFVGDIEAYPNPEPFKLATTAGQEREAVRYGRIRFDLGGAPQVLQVYRLLDVEPQEGSEGFFLAFYDGTTGSETYPAGRYLEIDGLPGGPYVLDFNMAFNPSCAYGDPTRFACPMAPRENRISARIEAGERGFHREPGTPAG
jgi:uncharacterized protein (DUF1684 family)